MITNLGCFKLNEVVESNTKRKIVLSEDNVYLQTDNDRDDGSFSGSSHQSSVVFDLKLLIVYLLSKIRCCYEYVAEPRLHKCDSKRFSWILQYPKTL